MTRTPLEQDLIAGLDELAGIPAGGHDLLAGVTRKRHDLVKRRAAVSGAVALTAAAVLTSAVLALPSGSGGPANGTPGGKAPTPAASTAAPILVSGALKAAALPPGPAPAIPFAKGRALFDGDIEVALPFDAANVETIVRLGDGWLVVTYPLDNEDPVQKAVIRVERDGSLSTLTTTVYSRSLTSNAAHTRAAWADGAGRLVSTDSGGALTTSSEQGDLPEGNFVPR
ncbi:hypothetical protein G9H71_22570, partial [Motilibacter sp. E257]